MNQASANNSVTPKMNRGGLNSLAKLTGSLNNEHFEYQHCQRVENLIARR